MSVNLLIAFYSRLGSTEPLARLIAEGAKSAFQALAHETKDHGEALDAYFDKREPKFTGN